jgi:hypothetical protein
MLSDIDRPADRGGSADDELHVPGCEANGIA